MSQHADVPVSLQHRSNSCARPASPRSRARAPRCRFPSRTAAERADRRGAAAVRRRCATCRCGRRRPTALAVRARVSRLDFLPPVTISVQIEQQPQLPDTPLVVRILSLPGLLSMAGSLLSPSSLPPGIRLDRERVLVDVRQLLEKKGLGEIVPLIERLHVSSEEGRLLVDVDIRVTLRAAARRGAASEFPPGIEVPTTGQEHARLQFGDAAGDIACR